MTAFRTPFGNFYYVVMPFGLKNAGATYQRAMHAIFHDMIHNIVEDYVDDVVVKSKKKTNHVEDLKKVFERCRQYKLKMNPKKCAFGMTAGKFLGFLVHNRGLEVDPNKAKAITEMPPPKTQKQLKSFLGRVSYLRRFVPALAEVTEPFGKLLKGKAKWDWGQEQQRAFEKVKEILASAKTMVVPQRGIPLQLYITSTSKSIGGVITQEVDGDEKPVYYVSRIVRGPETRYSQMERHCLALVFIAQKMRHYFLAHEVQLITKTDPIRYLLMKPALLGRPARWMMILSEYDIKCVTPKAIRCQALVDLLAQFPNGEYEPPSEDLPGGEVELLDVEKEDLEWWNLAFDGSSADGKGGAGVVLTTGKGKEVALSYKLDFSCTNNEAEYEAFILGMLAARELGAKFLKVRGDSNLIVQQVRGQFAVKEPILAPYRTVAQKVMEAFRKVVIEYVPREQNKQPDALATIASRVYVTGEDMDVKVIKRTLPTTVLESFPKELTDDWRHPISHQLQTKEGTIPLVELQKYRIIKGILYHREADGVLTRCLGRNESRRILHQVHDDNCGLAEISLYRRLQ